MRNLGRHTTPLFLGIAACTSLWGGDSFAQSYPVKPIRILVGFPPGNATDFTARLVAQKLSERMGQQMFVENRAGLDGSIATERIAKSPPDGYTLLMMPSGETARPALRANLPYDLERDLAPVSLVVTTTLVLLVHPSLPARNVKELIALARSQPGKLSYGSTGVGSSSHLVGELFNLMAKVNIVQVAYKSSTESAVATAGGQIEMSFGTITSVLPLLAAGKLRALAVTSAQRASLMSSIPTLDESGLRGYDRSSWVGMMAPAGVTKDVIARLNANINDVVNTPEIKESFNKQGLEPRTNTPEQFAVLIRSDIAENAKLIRLTGAKAD